jgi:hypothetical protein
VYIGAAGGAMSLKEVRDKGRQTEESFSPSFADIFSFVFYC